jgi:hypothetical protein
MKSRTTPILEGGDDEDIAKMESRTTLIQEREDVLIIPTPLALISNDASGPGRVGRGPIN